MHLRHGLLRRPLQRALLVAGRVSQARHLLQVVVCVLWVSDRSGQCECVYGFSGTKCDTECNRTSTCHGHGDCVGGGYCVCDAGYEGEYCEKKEADYSMVVLLFVVANVVVAFLWYRGRVGGCESVLSLLVLSLITHHITSQSSHHSSHHSSLITSSLIISLTYSPPLEQISFRAQAVLPLLLLHP